MHGAENNWVKFNKDCLCKHGKQDEDAFVLFQNAINTLVKHEKSTKLFKYYILNYSVKILTKQAENSLALSIELKK